MATTYTIIPPAALPTVFVGAYARITLNITKTVDGIASRNTTEFITINTNTRVISDERNYSFNSDSRTVDLFVMFTDVGQKDFSVTINGGDPNATGTNATILTAAAIAVNITNTDPVAVIPGSSPTVFDVSQTTKVTYNFMVTTGVAATPVSSAFIGLIAESPPRNTFIFSQTTNTDVNDVALIALNNQGRLSNFYTGTNAAGVAQINFTPRGTTTTWSNLFYVMTPNRPQLPQIAVFNNKDRDVNLPGIRGPVNGLLNLDNFPGDNVTLTIDSIGKLVNNFGLYYQLNDSTTAFLISSVATNGLINVTVPKNQFKVGALDNPISNNINFIVLTNLNTVSSSLNTILKVVSKNGGGGGNEIIPQGRLGLPFLADFASVFTPRFLQTPCLVRCDFDSTTQMNNTPLFTTSTVVVLTVFIDGFIDLGVPDQANPKFTPTSFSFEHTITAADIAANSFTIDIDRNNYQSLSSSNGLGGTSGNVTLQWKIKGATTGNSASQAHNYNLFT